MSEVTQEMKTLLRAALGKEYPLDWGAWAAFEAGRKYERAGGNSKHKPCGCLTDGHNWLNECAYHSKMRKQTK